MNLPIRGHRYRLRDSQWFISIASEKHGYPARPSSELQSSAQPFETQKLARDKFIVTIVETIHRDNRETILHICIVRIKEFVSYESEDLQDTQGLLERVAGTSGIFTMDGFTAELAGCD